MENVVIREKFFIGRPPDQYSEIKKEEKVGQMNEYEKNIVTFDEMSQHIQK